MNIPFLASEVAIVPLSGIKNYNKTERKGKWSSLRNPLPEATDQRSDSTELRCRQTANLWERKGNKTSPIQPAIPRKKKKKRKYGGLPVRPNVFGYLLCKAIKGLWESGDWLHLQNEARQGLDRQLKGARGGRRGRSQEGHQQEEEHRRQAVHQGPEVGGHHILLRLRRPGVVQIMWVF